MFSAGDIILVSPTATLQWCVPLNSVSLVFYRGCFLVLSSLMCLMCHRLVFYHFLKACALLDTGVYKPASDTRSGAQMSLQGLTSQLVRANEILISRLFDAYAGMSYFCGSHEATVQWCLSQLSLFDRTGTSLDWGPVHHRVKQPLHSHSWSIFRVIPIHTRCSSILH